MYYTTMPPFCPILTPNPRHTPYHLVTPTIGSEECKHQKRAFYNALKSTTIYIWIICYFEQCLISYCYILLLTVQKSIKYSTPLSQRIVLFIFLIYIFISNQEQYKAYEAKWKNWRNQLVQRREQMRKKREAKMAELAKVLQVLRYSVTLVLVMGLKSEKYNSHFQQAQKYDLEELNCWKKK